MNSEGEAKWIKLLTRQFGVVRADQLAAFGFGRKFVAARLKARAWTRLQRGVYLTSSSSPSIAQRELAALFAAGEGAVLSHHSAARHLGLEGAASELVHVTVPHGRTVQALTGVVVHRSRDLDPTDVTTRGIYRYTKVGRTVLDLASALEPEWLTAVVHSSLRLNAGNLKWLWFALRAHGPGRPGATQLRKTLLDCDRDQVVPDSLLESLACELGFWVGNLPLRHLLVPTPASTLEVDLAWPELKLCVELDSWLHHSSRVAFERDRARDRALVSAGWVAVRYTWRSVRLDRQLFIDELRQTCDQRRRELAQRSAPAEHAADGA